MTALEVGGGDWLRTVTASKLPAIVGLSRWTGPAEMWATMRGDIERDTSTSDVQQRGHDLEPRALRLFWKSDQRPDYVQESGEITVARDDLPFPAAASPDSSGRDHEGRRVFCEAKTVGNFDSARQWGQPGTDEIPQDYWAQCQWQMHMTRLDAEPVDTTYVSLLGPVLDDHNVYRVDYDAGIVAQMVDRVTEFYASLDDDDGMPATDGLPSTYRLFGKLNPEVERQAEWEIAPDLAVDYLAAHEAHAAATSELTRQKSEILRVAGTAQYVMCGGVKVARRQMARGTPTLRHVGVTVDALEAALADGDATAA